MVKEIRYTTIRRVMDNLMDNPLLSDITPEQVVRYTVRFIEINGFPRFYQDKTEEVDIHQYRGLLPCDLISIVQVKDCHSGICMRAMTDTFYTDLEHREGTKFHSDLSFKTQGNVIFTSFPEGRIEIAYKSIPVDDNGFPMLIDNENYLAALEAYIKKQVFTIKFDQGKIATGILENAKQEYAWLVGQLNSEFNIPSVSEMESITRYMTSMIKSPMHFDQGFKHLGNREYIKKH